MLCAAVKGGHESFQKDFYIKGTYFFWRTIAKRPRPHLKHHEERPEGGLCERGHIAHKGLFSFRHPSASLRIPAKRSNDSRMDELTQFYRRVIGSGFDGGGGNGLSLGVEQHGSMDKASCHRMRTHGGACIVQSASKLQQRGCVFQSTGCAA